jgi:hypothetical protein
MNLAKRLRNWGKMTKSTLLKFFCIGFLIVVFLSGMFFFFGSTENNQVEVAANSIQDSTNKPDDTPISKLNPTTNKPNPIWNEKVEKDAKLQSRADLLLRLFDKMPQVPVFIKDEPILETGTNTERGLAYTICEPGDKPTIFIKKVFYLKKNEKQITNVLKHELTHAYFCRQGVQVGHDDRWRKKFESIGGFGN